MKQRGVAIRGIVPLVLCASVAARMPLAGKAAFANLSVLRSCSRRGSTLSPKGTNTKKLWRRRLPFGRRNVDSGGAALRFASSAAAGGDLADDELDALVKTTVAALPARPRVAVVGAGFAGLATAYHLARFGSDVTVYDPNEAGAAGASSVAAGLLHPLTPRGKLIWKGEEGYKAAKHLIETVNAEIIGDAAAASDGDEGKMEGLRGCVTAENVYRPLLDDNQLDLFTKAAEDLPQWVESLTREELMEAVPGSTADCLGGVRIRGALAVDAPTYLKGLWAACCGLLNTAKSSSQDSGGGDSAMWVRRSVEDIHALASSGDYNAVVACVGAGVRVLAGVKDIVSLQFVRGQSLLYDNVKQAAAGGAGGDGGSTAAGAKGDGGKLLQNALLCGQYVVPTTVDEAGEAGGNGGRILLGSTQEHVMSGQQIERPPEMAKALRQLRPKVAKFFPALDEVEPVGVTSGVRVIQDRNSYGRIPIAGRLPFSKRGWVIAALGARGLIHHAYLGKLVAACALLDSDERLPPQVMAPLEDLGKQSTGDL